MPSLVSFSASLHLTLQDISCAAGQCPRPLVSASRWSPLSRPRLTDWLRRKVCRWDPRELFKPQFSHRCSRSGCPWLSPRPPNSGLGVVVQQYLSFVYSHAFRNFGFSVTQAHLSGGLGFKASYCWALCGSPPLSLHLA